MLENRQNPLHKCLYIEAKRPHFGQLHGASAPSSSEPLPLAPHQEKHEAYRHITLTLCVESISDIPKRILSLSIALLMLFTLLTLVGIANAIAVPRDSGLKIIISNDDGWATANIRTFATTLKSFGYQVGHRNTIVSK